MQAELLRQTCQSPVYPATLSTIAEPEDDAQDALPASREDTIFIASYLNL